MIVRFDGRLIEEAVRIAVSEKDERRFQGERDRVYDEEDRESGFAKLYDRWFLDLGLDQPVHEALAHQPQLDGSVARVVVGPAVRAFDEGAELFVRRPEPGVSQKERNRVVIRLRPETMANRSEVERVLARELLHVSDMLDPDFGYSPTLPAGTGGQTHDRVLMDRYSAAWSTSVAGRLVHDGRWPAEARQDALAAFRRMLPTFEQGREIETVFGRLFDPPRPTHRDLVRFAENPREWAGLPSKPGSGAHCALCRMPTAVAETIEEPEVAARVRRDFPQWDPSEQACPQCVELYRVRVSEDAMHART